MKAAQAMKRVNPVKGAIKRENRLASEIQEILCCCPAGLGLRKKNTKCEKRKKKKTNKQISALRDPGQAESYTAEAFKKFPLGFTPAGPEGPEEPCAKTSGTKKMKKEKKKELSPNQPLTSALFI